MSISNHFSLLEMIEHPAFCVRDGIIVKANEIAKQMFFDEGSAVMRFLPKDGPAYQAFTGGCLYLNVASSKITSGASVTRIDDFDLFMLDTEGSKLEAYALAAMHLKIPLCTITNLFEATNVGDKQYEPYSRALRKYLYQLNRIVGNMSDANWMRNDSRTNLEPTELSSLFAEIMEKMDTVVTTAGDRLEFQNITAPVHGLADRDLLERAIANILSNAVKFSPANSTIRASVTQKDDFLYFTVSDPGDSPKARCNVFTRYLRPAIIEDKRHGLGLGMAIVHAVAMDHGGTVLVDTPPEGGTRLTFSICLRMPRRTLLRSTIDKPSTDRYHGLEPSLVEFADVLPTDVFEKRK